MLTSQLIEQMFYAPISEGADSLYIIASYASPAMASWLIGSIAENNLPPININLILGMTPYDGISIVSHESFKKLQSGLPSGLSSFRCSYLTELPPCHGNLYIWLTESSPKQAFLGSADFTQKSFLSHRLELIEPCNPKTAYDYFNELESKSIYCDNGEVDNFIPITGKHFVDEDNAAMFILDGENVEKVTLSLLDSKGEVGRKSGLNWGHRDNRNRNEAYIPVPRHIAKTGFFPSEKKHFTVLTDDGVSLVLRAEQQHDKAITTPLNNSHLGEYLRRRLSLEDGAFVQKEDLIRYGRTDIVFAKLDEEQYYMDFSSPHAEFEA